MTTPLRFILFIYCCLVTVMASAQVSIGAYNYPTLKTAFDAINAGVHTGVISVTISGSTTETATAVLNASGSGAASYTNIAINATATATVSSSLAGTTIQFNGADGVSLNGANMLSIVNTHATGSVISLVNDATNNAIINTSITGNTASYSTAGGVVAINAGVISFGAGSGGINTGNNNNTVDNCDINGNNQAICLVYSQGSTASSTASNFQNTVKNSRLFNFINPAIAGANAVFLNIGNDKWTLQNNSIYLTAPVSTAQQYVFRGILILPAYTSDSHTVEGNFFGGNGPSATGTMTVAGAATNAVGFVAFDIETGGTGNLISNNTVKNINLTYSATAGSFANSGFFGFIGGFSGSTTFTNNEVSNIALTNSAGTMGFQGIHVNGRVTVAGAVTPTFNVTNNNINTITLVAGGTGNVQMMGMRLETSSLEGLTNTSTSNPSFNVTGNTISNMNANFAGTTTYVRGISTITTNGTGSNPSTAVLLPKVNITNNTIHSLSTISALANYAGPPVSGIFFGGTNQATNTDVQVISQNTIYNLAATNTGNVGTVVTGIIAHNGLHQITRNRIYDLKNASTASAAAAPGIVGINIRNATGVSTTANNFISLGTNVTEGVQVFGFLQNVDAAGPVNVYHNSIYIGGTAASGDKRSAALVRGTELFGTGILTPMDVKNNILYNARTGGGGSHYAIVNSETAPATGYTSDANVLYTVNPLTIAMWGGTNNDLATYKANSGDVNSKTVAVNFANVATGDLHLAGASNGDNNLGAAPVPGITIDYDAEARNATRVYIGADEGTVVLPIELISFIGHKEGNTNKLVWTTASEINNREFELQRSADGRNFSRIATIASKAEDGNSNTSITYSFNDEKILPGINYYRLKQTDKDGRSSYATVMVVLKRDSRNFEITSVYPNPAKNVLNLMISSPANSRADVLVMDLSGKPIRQLYAAIAQGENSISLDVASLAAGTYLVRIVDSNNEVKTVRFVKQ